jgi:hypothetical protein
MNFMSAIILLILISTAYAGPGRPKNASSAAPIINGHEIGEIGEINEIGFLTEYWLLLILLMLAISVPFVVVYYHYRKSKSNINTMSNVSATTSGNSSFLLSLFRFWYDTPRYDRAIFATLWLHVFASSLLLLASGCVALGDFQSTQGDPSNDSTLRALRNASRVLCTISLLLAVLVGWRAHRQCLQSVGTEAERIELRPMGVQVYH